MDVAEIDKSKLVQNLKDAGCSSGLIEKFVEVYDSKSVFEQKKILSGHRSSLLDKIHDGQKKLDCLDYLIYQLSQNGRAKGKITWKKY